MLHVVLDTASGPILGFIVRAPGQDKHNGTERAPPELSAPPASFPRHATSSRCFGPEPRLQLDWLDVDLRGLGELLERSP